MIIYMFRLQTTSICDRESWDGSTIPESIFMGDQEVLLSGISDREVAIGMIEKELKVTLPQDEAAFIALHIVNAELDLDMTEMVSMTEACEWYLKIVDKHFGEQIDKESVFYERFITHLKFFAQRVILAKKWKVWYRIPGDYKE